MGHQTGQYPEISRIDYADDATSIRINSKLGLEFRPL